MSKQLGPLIADVQSTTLCAADLPILQHPTLGGIILFARNYQDPSQLSKLCRDIRQASERDLLIAVDQEGGRVQRFREGFCPLPALRQLGELHDQDPKLAIETANLCGQVMAGELRNCAIDMSFAPVLDTADPASEVIASRAFHPKPAVITDLARAYIGGMSEQGMVATGKHFPGHGGVTADSHVSEPQDLRSLNILQQHDMRPFTELASQLNAVMTCHLTFPNIDNYPPTFSKFWLQHILRQSLGFKGVIFSDDLSMQGAASAGDICERVLTARAAGCDGVLVCNQPEQALLAANALQGAGYDEEKIHQQLSNLHIDTTLSQYDGQPSAQLQSLCRAYPDVFTQTLSR